MAEAEHTLPGAGQPPPTAEEICRDYAPRIYALALRMLGNQADAEDVTQDALLQVLRKRHTFRGEAAFSTWVHRLAVNAVLAFRRRRGTREDHQARAPVEDFLEDGRHRAPVRRWSAPPEEGILDKEARRAIEEAIARLPDLYRDVYVLADVEGLPNAEIAEMLGLGVPAVKSRLHRARLLMRKALAPYFEESA